MLRINSFIVKDPTQEPNERVAQGSVGLRAGQSSVSPVHCPPSTGLYSPTEAPELYCTEFIWGFHYRAISEVISLREV